MEKTAELLKIAGDRHCYQYTLLFVICLKWMVFSLSSFMIVFLMKQPGTASFDYSTLSFTNSPFSYEKCEHDYFILDSPKTTWLTSNPEILCNPFLTGFFSTSVLAAYFIGGFMTNLISDTFGRLACFYMSTTVGILTLLFLGTFSHYICIYIGLFVINAFNSILTAMSTSYLFENISPELREPFASVKLSFYGIATLAFMFLFIVFQDWQLIMYLYALFLGIFLVILYFTAKESPNFFVLQGDKEGLINNLTGIARFNQREEYFRKEISTINETTALKGGSLYEEFLDSLSPQKESSWKGAIKLFSYPSIRLNFLLIALLNFSINYTYYGCSYYVKNMKGNFYLNAAFMVGLETVGYLGGTLMNMIPFIKRRESFMVCFTVIGVGYSIKLLYPSDTTLNVATLANKLMSSIAFYSYFIVNNEIFPTPVRAAGNAYAAAFGKIGAIISGMMIELIGEGNTAVYIGMSVLAIMVALKMPETRGVALKDFIEE